MKYKALAALAIALVLLASPGLCQVEQNPNLDAAFSMIEQGNLFLEKYNELTGAGVEARLEFGAPYCFGGSQKEEDLLVPRKALETTKYYRAGKRYLGGFDCAGFARWVCSQVGKPKLDTLEYLITKKLKYKDNQLPIKDKPYDELKDYLEVGDFLVAKKGARHIMMYIGTLADYGYTEATAPELAAYLEYPLVIHSGHNPMHGAWYAKYIEDNEVYNCVPPDGGVCVSIVGVREADAPNMEQPQVKEEYFFLLDDYKLTVYDLEPCTSYVWLRWP